MLEFSPRPLISAVQIHNNGNDTHSIHRKIAKTMPLAYGASRTNMKDQAAMPRCSDSEFLRPVRLSVLSAAWQFGVRAFSGRNSATC